MYKSYLWAPGRIKWVTRLTRGRPSRCPFCLIAKGDSRVPSRVLYRDKLVMVIMNIFPYNPGHLQVVPVRHVVWLEELTPEEYSKFCGMIKKSIVMLKKAISPLGFNVGINLGGEVSGGSILHLHCQIVPRFKRDLGFMEVTADTKVMPESLDDTFKKLKKYAHILKE